MKHIKRYNKDSENFKIGDYVIEYNLTTTNTELTHFLMNNVGEVVENIKNTFNRTKFLFAPSTLIGDGIVFDNNEYIYLYFNYEIRHATKEEIEDYLLKKNTMKYNL